ncbi:MAG TPA: hypothetical protein PKZ76_00595 [Xanthomonadaceae bacterium]|nr:hypothetical protein [Xanthomonadaceae bacterium]
MRKLSVMLSTLLAAASPTVSAELEQAQVLAGFERAKAAFTVCGPDLVYALHPAELSGYRMMAEGINFRALDPEPDDEGDHFEAFLNEVVDGLPMESLRLILELRSKAEALRFDADGRALVGILCDLYGETLAEAVAGMEAGEVRIEADAALLELSRDGEPSTRPVALMRDAHGWRTVDLLEHMQGDLFEFAYFEDDSQDEALSEDAEIHVLRARVHAMEPPPFALPAEEMQARLFAMIEPAQSVHSEAMMRLQRNRRAEILQRGDGLLEAHEAASLYLMSRRNEEADAIDSARVIESLLHASGEGDVVAADTLARIHEDGRWVRRDSAAALLWYRRALEGGYEHAAVSIANLTYSLDSDLAPDCGATIAALENVDLESTWGAGARLAWVLATCPEAEMRDGKRALAIVNQVIGDSEARFGADHVGRDLKEALAAAYCEIGEFELALLTMDEVMDRNTCGVDPGQLKRWEMYGAQQCWRGPRD